MKQEELQAGLIEFFGNLDLEVDYKDFNIYTIKFYPEWFEVEFDYRYDNYLTITGNVFKVIEEISKKIINYYKGEDRKWVNLEKDICKE